MYIVKAKLKLGKLLSTFAHTIMKKNKIFSMLFSIGGYIVGFGMIIFAIVIIVNAEKLIQMNTWLKITLEVVLIFATFFCSRYFWIWRKTLKMLKYALFNNDLLRNLFKNSFSKHYYDRAKLSEVKSDIVEWMKEITELNNARNMAVVFLIVLCVIGYLLGIIYFLILIIVIFMSYNARLISFKTTDINFSISKIMDGIEYWNENRADECKEFCMVSHWNILKHIYEVVTEVE